MAARAAGTVTDTFADYVVGHGELWCAQLFAATVRRLGAECEFMDTREARLPLRTSRSLAVALTCVGQFPGAAVGGAYRALTAEMRQRRLQQ